MNPKKVVRAVVRYEVGVDNYLMRLYYEDKTTELFELSDGVKKQLEDSREPQDHHEWLKEFHGKTD